MLNPWPEWVLYLGLVGSKIEESRRSQAGRVILHLLSPLPYSIAYAGKHMKHNVPL